MLKFYEKIKRNERKNINYFYREEISDNEIIWKKRKINE